jgi:hypothetical protein
MTLKPILVAVPALLLFLTSLIITPQVGSSEIRSQDGEFAVSVPAAPLATMRVRADATDEWRKVDVDTDGNWQLDPKLQYRLNSARSPAGYLDSLDGLTRVALVELRLGIMGGLSSKARTTLANLQRLERVEIERGLDASALEWLGDLPVLRSVRLPKSAVDGDLVRRIIRRPSLRELELAGGGHHPFELKILEGSSLESLALLEWDLRSDSLPNLAHLKQLELRGCEIGLELVGTIVGVPNLTELDLYRSRLANTNLSSLKLCQQLSTLSLAGCSEADDSTLASLAGHRSLESLTLVWAPGGRTIGSRTAPRLTKSCFESLATMPALRQLRIPANRAAEPEYKVALAQFRSSRPEVAISTE